MKKIVLLSLLMTSALMVTGCKGKKKGESEDDGKITVNFYLDYNQITAGEVYYSYRIDNNSKLTAPPTPTEGKYPEFTVFKGWSHKELIYNMDELWKFDTDVMVAKEGYRTFDMFGQWVSQGE